MSDGTYVIIDILFIESSKGSLKLFYMSRDKELEQEVRSGKLNGAEALKIAEEEARASNGLVPQGEVAQIERADAENDAVDVPSFDAVETVEEVEMAPVVEEAVEVAPEAPAEVEPIVVDAPVQVEDTPSPVVEEVPVEEAVEEPALVETLDEEPVDAPAEESVLNADPSAPADVTPVEDAPSVDESAPLA